MNVTESIVQVKQNRRIRISKNAIFTNGIFLFNIKSQDVKTITHKTEKTAEGTVTTADLAMKIEK